MTRRVLLFLLLLFASQELALRIAFPVPEVSGFDRIHYAPLAPLPAAAAPDSLAHASFSWISDPDGFAYVHRLNLHGFRDGEWTVDAAPEAERVIFVGDSFVEGFSAEADESIPAVFRQRAAEAGAHADVLNLGLGGAGLASYVRLLRDAVPLFRPDTLVLVLFANDVVGTRFDPAWLADPVEVVPISRWQPRLLEVTGALAAGRRPARRWHSPPFSFLPAVPDPRNPWSDGRSAGRLEAFVEPEIARAMRAGRFNPALTDYLPWFQRNLQRPVELDGTLKAIQGFLRPHGVRLLVAYLPSKNQVSDRYLAAQSRYSPPDSVTSLSGPAFQLHARLLAGSCKKLSLACLDLSPRLREREAAGPALYWGYDDHMRAEGYRVVGEQIFEWWQEQRAHPPAT